MPHEGLTRLPGIGPKRAALLESLGIRSVRDLALHSPRAWRDLRFIRRVADLSAGAESTVRVRFRRGSAVRKAGRPFYRGLFEDDSGRIEAFWFHAPYLRDRFEAGAEYLLTGRPARGKTWTLTHPETEEAAETGPSLHVGRVVPVYPATEGLSQRLLRKAVFAALERAEESWDWIPAEALRREGEPALPETLSRLHFPPVPIEARRAREALAWREGFLFHAAVLRERRRREAIAGHPLPATGEIDRRIRARLPFALRADQEKAVREIAADLARGFPARRILIGDVGSGKTAVALYACLTAVAQRKRAAILAPTTVLAEQHFRTFSRWLAGSRVRISLAAGDGGRGGDPSAADLVVGTHALLAGGRSRIDFALLVIDEQHRFGVIERSTLSGRSLAALRRPPHVIELSATPIPRTLLAVLEGGIDLSILRGDPSARRRVRTVHCAARQRPAVWSALRKEIGAGAQAYVVCPRIEGGAEERSAIAVHRELIQGPLRGLSVGLAHGKMDAIEKESVLRRFAEGKIQALVATSLVEVGLDVPNASVMAIEEAHRFGLSQLHQLRGRIGRGERPSACYLLGEADTPEGEARLNALASTADGARLAEADLRLRGGGRWFGTEQSGLAGFFHFLDPLRDRTVSKAARLAVLRWAEAGGAWTPAMEAELLRRTAPERG